jgi:hypothetical protein
VYVGVKDIVVDWTSILASIAALFVALLTFFNIRIARSTLRVMEQREKRLHPSLQVFHIDSHVKRHIEHDSRVYVANIGITCTSDVDNSIKDISLTIYFKRGGETTSNIVIPTLKDLNNLADFVGTNPNEIITIPKRIKAHEVVRGWIAFEISDRFLASSRIENYRLTLKDSNDVESFFEIKVMKEV